MFDWMSQLDERQQKEVFFANAYVDGFDHGTAGHNRLVLIDKLSKLLNERPDQPPRKTSILPVPYHSQHEADAQWFRKDCGPSCVEMIGKFYHPDATITTNEIMRFITSGVDRSVYISELQNACLHFFDVSLTRHNDAEWEDLIYQIEAGVPVIVLVHYGSYLMRTDRNYVAGHYIVICGHDAVDYQGKSVARLIVHDPNIYSGVASQGAFLPITFEHFMNMWNDCYKDGNPIRMMLVPEVKNDA